MDVESAPLADPEIRADAAKCAEELEMAAPGLDDELGAELLVAAAEIRRQWLGDLRGASALIRRAVERFPPGRGALARLRELSEVRGEWAELADSLDVAAKGAKSDELRADLLALRGDVVGARLGRLAEARGLYRDAARLSPSAVLRQAASAMIERIDAHLSDARPIGAGASEWPPVARPPAAEPRSVIRTRAELLASTAALLFRGAASLLDGGTPDAARPLVDAGLRLDPEHERGRLLLRRLLRAQGRFGELVDVLAVLAQRSRNPSAAEAAWLEAAQLAAGALGDVERAVQLCRECLRRDPASDPALAEGVALGAGIGMLDVARRLLPDLPPAQRVARVLALAEAAVVAGDERSADAYRLAAVEDAPDDVRCFRAAVERLRSLDDKQALILVLARRARLIADPVELRAIHLELAALRDANGQPREAAQSLVEAIRLATPEDDVTEPLATIDRLSAEVQDRRLLAHGVGAAAARDGLSPRVRAGYLLELGRLLREEVGDEAAADAAFEEAQAALDASPHVGDAFIESGPEVSITESDWAQAIQNLTPTSMEGDLPYGWAIAPDPVEHIDGLRLVEPMVPPLEEGSTVPGAGLDPASLRIDPSAEPLGLEAVVGRPPLPDLALVAAAAPAGPDGEAVLPAAARPVAGAAEAIVAPAGALEVPAPAPGTHVLAARPPTTSQDGPETAAIDPGLPGGHAPASSDGAAPSVLPGRAQPAAPSAAGRGAQEVADALLGALRASDLDRALELLRGAAAPAPAGLWVRAGELALVLDRGSDARAAFAGALERVGHDAALERRSRRGLAEALSRVGHFAEAAEALAPLADAGDRPALERIGRLFLQAGEEEQALRWLGELFVREPSDVSAAKALLEILVHRADTDAIAVLAEKMGSRPLENARLSEWLVALGVARRVIGDIAGARQSLVAGLDADRFDPRPAEELFELARRARRDDWLDEALRELRVRALAQGAPARAFLASSVLVARGSAQADDRATYEALRISCRSRPCAPLGTAWIRPWIDGDSIEPPSPAPPEFGDPLPIEGPLAEALDAAEMAFGVEKLSVRELGPGAGAFRTVATPVPTIGIAPEVLRTRWLKELRFDLARCVAALAHPRLALALNAEVQGPGSDATPPSKGVLALDRAGLVLAGDAAIALETVGARTARGDALAVFALSRELSDLWARFALGVTAVAKAGRGD